MESKSSSALRKDGQSDATCVERAAVAAFCVFYLPVVEQDVRSPDLVCGETEVFHTGMFTLVPLEVVVEPALKRTQTRSQCGLQGGQEKTGTHGVEVRAFMYVIKN